MLGHAWAPKPPYAPGRGPRRAAGAQEEAGAAAHGSPASGKIRITSLEPSRRLECFERQLRVEPREGVRQPPLQYDDAVVGSLLAWSAGADVGAVRGLPATGRQPPRRSSLDIGFGDGGRWSLPDSDPRVLHNPELPLGG